MNPQSLSADALRELGMHPKYKGYAYLLCILPAAAKNPVYAYNLKQAGYPLVMQYYDVSIAGVERNIRFAINKTWEEGNQAAIHRYFGAYETGYAPTNSEFIAVLIECIQYDRVMHRRRAHI